MNRRPLSLSDQQMHAVQAAARSLLRRSAPLSSKIWLAAWAINRLTPLCNRPSAKYWQ